MNELIKILTSTFIIITITSIVLAQGNVPEEVSDCKGCTETVFRFKGGLLMTLKIQGVKININERNKDDLTCLLECKELSSFHQYSIANRMAGHFMYHDGNRDSVIKYMEIAFEASPFDFCKTNYMVDDWIQNDPSFKDFFPMYIRMLSEDIWRKKIKQCRECCPETLVIEPPKSSKETPKNVDYYNALLTVHQNDQKYRNGNYQGSTFVGLQPVLDQENRDMLDSLYQIYGLPYKDDITSNGIGICWYVLMHSTDCEWNEKWIDRYLSAYENGETRSVEVKIPIDRLFQYGEDSIYDYEKAFCNDADIFLEKMKKKYGAELAIKLGYN